MNVKFVSINSFSEAVEQFNAASEKKLEILQTVGGYATVLIEGQSFQLLLPRVESLEVNNPMAAQVVYTGLPKKSLLTGISQVRRLSRVRLRNSALPRITSSTPPEVAEVMLEQGVWYLCGFWALYLEALIEAAKVAFASRQLSAPRLQSIFNKKITALLGKLPLVNSDAHLASHGRTIQLDYPGEDLSQGVIVSRLPQELLTAVRQKFLAKAEEIGCNIIVTPKSHPGRIVAYTPDGKSKSQVLLGIWSNFACDQRVSRELFSAIPNAQQYANQRYSKPLVSNDLGTPRFLEGRVKFLNSAVFSFPELVPEVGGKPTNVDQILGTGWVKFDGATTVVSETTQELPLEDGDLSVNSDGKLVFNEEAVLSRWSKSHPGYEAAASLSIRPDGALFEMFSLISIKREEGPDMVYKIENADACKGMVVPENVLLLEKREGEDFFRPIYFLFPKEAVVKKEAFRAVLRMLTSQLPEEERTGIPHDTPREEFNAVMKETLRKLGRSPYSELFKVNPGKDRIPVLGFNQESEGILPIEEDKVGTVIGTLVPILDKEGTPATAVCGEQPIMRLPEDEDFGEPVRLREHGNAIRLDPFLVLGKEGLTMEVDEKTKQIVNKAVELYRLIK